MKKEIPTYELYIADVNTEGIQAISIVETPAIGQDFMYFNKTHKENGSTKLELAKVDIERRQIYGPILIPDKKIIRIDEYGELFYVFFSVNLIEELAQKYLKESKLHQTTVDHQYYQNGIHMIESYIIETPEDKAYAKYGYNINDVPVGSWMGKYLIDKSNTDIIERIKDKTINGFSVELWSSQKLIKQSKSQLEELFERLEAFQDKNEIINIIKTIKNDKL